MNYAICCQRKAVYLWSAWREPDTGSWTAIDRLDDLTVARLEEIEPDRLFFTHWSRKVPVEIHDRWECVNFHCTPLPFGRGSSPVQNMILRGHEETKVTAHQMVEAYDAGRILMQKPMSLLGGGREIYLRLGGTIRDMIHELVRRPDHYPPRDQEGETILFERRTPDQSNLRLDENRERWRRMERLFDFIRMLDVDGYPHAHFELDGVRFELTHPIRTLDGIDAHVRITKAE